jgi:chaperonin GroES
MASTKWFGSGVGRGKHDHLTIVETAVASRGALGIGEKTGANGGIPDPVTPTWTDEEKARLATRERMYLEPLGCNVVIRPATLGNVHRFTAEDGTQKQIDLPDTAQRKPSEGTVVAVGPGGEIDYARLNRDIIRAIDGGNFDGHIGVPLTPMRVRVGDKVLFHRYAGTEVRLPGTPPEEPSLLVMDEKSIVGILRRDERAETADEKTFPTSDPSHAEQDGTGGTAK